MEVIPLPQHLDNLRNALNRVSKQRVALEEKLLKERTKLSDAQRDVSRIQGSITKSTSSSLRASKERQIGVKSAAMARAQKAIVTLEKQLSAKTEELSRLLNKINVAEKAYRKKVDDEDKNRGKRQLEHQRAVTREMANQLRLARPNQTLDLSRLPEKIRVLFLASNPLDQGQLRLDEEIREIQTKIRASDYRDSVELCSRWAVRPGDLLQALNEVKPHIVHFSGHGDIGEIIFQGEDGCAKPVTKQAIVTTMAIATDNLRLVVFNTCFSADQANDMVKHVEAAIGMGDAVDDETARIFSGALYSSIGFGHSLQRAFAQARAQLMLEGNEEENIPQLYLRTGIDADNVVLVRPDRSHPHKAFSDKEILEKMAECFDRPAFQTPLQEESSFADFKKAITDTIEALNIGTRRSRDGHLFETIPSRHQLTDTSLQRELGEVVDSLRILRSRYDELSRAKDILPCDCGKPDCPIHQLTPNAIKVLEEHRSDAVIRFTRILSAVGSRVRLRLPI